MIGMRTPAPDSWLPVSSLLNTMQLDLEHVTIDYGARRVMANISLTLRVGEVLVVAGANGSGKSSLLRVLAGLQRPSGGTAFYTVAGQRFQPAEASGFVGWVAPDLQLYRELTALENLAFFAEVRGLHHSHADHAALLADVGLGGRGNDLLATFSSGMSYRLNYAFALLHSPLVLLLDEPTVTLDERGAAFVERVIERQRTRGLTVIATNDQRELRYGDYVLRLGG